MNSSDLDTIELLTRRVVHGHHDVPDELSHSPPRMGYTIMDSQDRRIHPGSMVQFVWEEAGRPLEYEEVLELAATVTFGTLG